jgi:hypothetical protein
MPATLCIGGAASAKSACTPTFVTPDLSCPASYESFLDTLVKERNLRRVDAMRSMNARLHSPAPSQTLGAKGQPNYFLNFSYSCETLRYTRCETFGCTNRPLYCS